MDGKVEMELMDSMISLYLKCQAKKIPITHVNIAGCSLISKGRTDLANGFYYNSDISHFLFIDSDLKFNADDIIKMYESDKDIIAGTYVKKGLNWDKIKKDVLLQKNLSPEDLLVNSGEYALHNLTGKKGDKIMKAEFVSTGMLMIKRNVFTKLQMYMDKEFYYFGGKKYYTYFETMLHPVGDRLFYLSEDFAFCKRADFAGFDINVLMDCNTTHYGRFAYKGNLKKYIDNNGNS